jgi:hypothetical protein
MYLCIKKRTSYVEDINVTCFVRVPGKEQFLIGGDTGAILHRSPDHKCTPRAYNLRKRSELPGITYATCIVFSPLLKGVFIAGYNSGEVALFAGRGTPIFIWNLELDVRDVKWSLKRPAVFFVLAESTVFVFDLLQSVTESYKTSIQWQSEVSSIDVGDAELYSSHGGKVGTRKLEDGLMEVAIDESTEVWQLINDA